jgi:hypothetical protein
MTEGGRQNLAIYLVNPVILSKKVILSTHFLCKTNPILCVFGPKTVICPKNKPNSKPIQTQTNPILAQKQRSEPKNKTKSNPFLANYPGSFKIQKFLFPKHRLAQKCRFHLNLPLMLRMLKMRLFKAFTGADYENMQIVGFYIGRAAALLDFIGG